MICISEKQKQKKKLADHGNLYQVSFDEPGFVHLEVSLLEGAQTSSSTMGYFFRVTVELNWPI